MCYLVTVRISETVISWDQDPALYFMPTVGEMIFRTDRPLAASSLYTSSFSGPAISIIKNFSSRCLFVQSF